MLPVGVDERLYSVVSAIHGVLLSYSKRCYLSVMTNKNETLKKFERSKIFMGKMIFNQEESFFSLTVSTLSTPILRLRAERFTEPTMKI